MDLIAHETFGWHRDICIAAAALVAHQALVFAVIGLVVTLVGWRRRRRWMAAAHLAALLAFLVIANALTWSTLYGMSVEETGQVTAYVGLAYRPVAIGFDVELIAFLTRGRWTMKVRYGRNVLQSRGLREHELGDARSTFDRIHRALARARVGGAWAGPRAASKEADALARAAARFQLVGLDGLNEAERVVWLVRESERIADLDMVYDGGLATHAPAAFRAIGAHRMAGLMEEAMSVREVEEPFHEQRQRMAALDAQFYAYPDPVRELMEAYVAEHDREIAGYRE